MKRISFEQMCHIKAKEMIDLMVQRHYCLLSKTCHKCKDIVQYDAGWAVKTNHENIFVCRRCAGTKLAALSCIINYNYVTYPSAYFEDDTADFKAIIIMLWIMFLVSVIGVAHYLKFMPIYFLSILPLLAWTYFAIKFIGAAWTRNNKVKISETIQNLMHPIIDNEGKLQRSIIDTKESHLHDPIKRTVTVNGKEISYQEFELQRVHTLGGEEAVYVPSSRLGKLVAK